ncbi:LysR substrate-binding domain-containing protein [Nocardia fluminea]|uniref:LysR substrate-binding domain-containing protein n=1 Tax=Nocardia fluminea TaxID=134984 RepID=UPI0033FE0B48
MLVTHGFVTDLPNETVFHDDWVVVTDRNHEPAGGELSTEDLQRRPWVLVYHSQTASTPAARRLRMLGIEPTRQIVTENFLTVQCLITGRPHRPGPPPLAHGPRDEPGSHRLSVSG